MSYVGVAFYLFYFSIRLFNLDFELDILNRLCFFCIFEGIYFRVRLSLLISNYEHSGTIYLNMKF